ncbi:MAG: 16S rRNA (cytosine(1402)-N(4))-methyltransferase RsmH [Thermoleophilia bacterium]|nr:16S rRNA (cytosine(1402)-N(4))-methyltransferase RsmH [Thermoleophilia bacterium]
MPAPETLPHAPVLLDEIVELLAPRAGDVVVDCTFGAGGHARALADEIGPDGTYIAIDQDPDVKPLFAAFAQNSACAARFVRANFADALADLRAEGVRADVILMDLGLSSMQIDRPERGFSYSRQAPLDMRMDPSRPESAATLVATASEADLTRWMRDYGEERYARPIARGIVRRRAQAPITTTADLVEVVKSAVPTAALFGGGHPAKRVFQALRIVVNDELGVLEEGLEDAFAMLAPGGRLGVICFHSLEDRMVKRFMRDRVRGCICPPGMPVCGCGRSSAAAAITTKAVRPSADEQDVNARAHSARFRAVMRREAA